MIKKIIFVLFVTVSIIAAQNSLGNSTQNNKPSFWHWLLPGGTHFFENNYSKGTYFALAEVGLLTSSILFDKNLKNNNSSEYYNYPFIFFSQLYTIDKGDYLLRKLNQNFEKKKFRYDIPNFEQMLKAPFDFDEIQKPFVLAFIVAGIVDAIISYSIAPKNQRLTGVDRVFGYGNEFNSAMGTAIYTATSGVMSYGAGVSEEMIMRGGILPVLDYKYGKKVGLTVSSLLFSAAHIPSYLKINDTKQLLYAITQITTVGFLLGMNAQNNHYNIKTVIAAHTWFNFMVMTTSWLLNPQENPLGFSVTFKL